MISLLTTALLIDNLKMRGQGEMKEELELYVENGF
jgi:hypothetical protein